MSILDRLKKGWNAFSNEDDSFDDGYYSSDFTGSFNNRSVSYNIHPTNSIVTTIYNRIAMDVADVGIIHGDLDDDGRYKKPRDSTLSECINVSPNSDQTPGLFLQDVVMTMCEEGVSCVVPVETSANPNETGSYDIHSLRVGTIKEWFPQHVRVNLYDERDGRRKDITLRKENVAIIENPLYSVMNHQNSTLMRLSRKLAMLDSVDEIASSGKLDVIVQLPYEIKGGTREQYAKKRKMEIETQLKGSKYGIAYIGATESITQLNRPAENNLLTQVQYLTESLYDQLGITQDVFNGTANAETMLSYNNRTIKPIIRAITEEFNRKFLTKTARSQNQKVMYHINPFNNVSMYNIADMADKFIRNEILTSNEVRTQLGFKPFDDEKADLLRNPNISETKQPENPEGNQNGNSEEET